MIFQTIWFRRSHLNITCNGALLSFGNLCCKLMPPMRFLTVAHRPYNQYDQAAARRVLTGKNVISSENPGIRLQTKFIEENQAADLVAELRQLDERFGFATAGHGLQILSVDKKKHEKAGNGVDTEQPREFFSRRVTGRPEGQEKAAAWGYGDNFRLDAVPQHLTALVEAVEKCGSFYLGPLRDITLNFRKNSFFRLDPHIDPAEDGPNDLCPAK